MPRIHSPSKDAIAANPRAYALYKQSTSNGIADAETLNAYVKQYGDPKKTAGSEELSFEEFASLFSRPGTAEGTNCVGWAARDKGSSLAPYSFDRRPVGPTDVRIQITHAGICHSDVHQVKDEWGGSLYPMVPGHEIVGIVTEVGPQVTRFAVGDRAGVGCMVDSCRTCDTCAKGEEQYCGKCTYTYNYKHADGTLAQGGYSTHIVVTEDFALRIPDALPLERTAPLLCAGITVYSPLRYYGLDRPGTRLGVVGLGGLGHMAVLIGKAMGAHVTVISTSRHKEQEALGLLGADAFLLSNDQAALQSAASSLDGIIDTVSAKHDLAALVGLLRVDGKLVMVGVPDVPLDMPAAAIVFKRVQIGGSLIGGIRETQEMLDFCAQHGVAAITETIPITQVNEAYTRMIKSDVKYRFVIDIQGSLVA